MASADKYRANAHHCQRMAAKALTPEDRLTWLNMAGDLAREMIPQRQRTPEETLEKTVRDRGTPQRPSKPQH